MAQTLDQQIELAQQSLNNLLAQRDALTAARAWNGETTVDALTHAAEILKLSGVTPAVVVYADGSIAIVRIDDIRASEPILHVEGRRR